MSDGRPERQARRGGGDLVVWPTGLARHGPRRLICAVGRGGFADDKREGDGAAPRGRFAIEAVFYRPDRMARPRTSLPVAPIRPGYGWSDDPNDPQYNQLIGLPAVRSHERLWRRDRLYDLIAVLDINRRPAIPGRGSAIFLHVWRAPRRPTAGCIAFAAPDLRAILAAWRPQDMVVIGGATSDRRRA